MATTKIERVFIDPPMPDENGGMMKSPFAQTFVLSAVTGFVFGFVNAAMIALALAINLDVSNIYVQVLMIAVPCVFAGVAFMITNAAFNLKYGKKKVVATP
jgi:hypothetical protein